ncbi:DNA-directed RNA polymerase [Dyella sp. ASV21]|uniref:DNA-directed RNA polymerase n=1 Tax=Dyella sp. ASV21 TaxID=2795114 RepID=UPI0018EABF35|nr:DNA-directed RNA polymerase [Dyella sp. ASV21]
MQHFTGLQYLKMDIAASFGFDKVTWNERLEWFEANKADLLHDPVRAAAKADEPAQALAGIMAFQDVEAGKPIAYLCGLDATASGLQLLSLLSGCERSASICNLIDTGRREDAYTATYNHMNAQLGTDGTIPRKDVKASLMTHLYGSKAVPKRTFGEDTPELRAFYSAVEELIPGADALNRDLITLWNPEAMSMEWTLPDGFEVVIKSMVTVESDVTFLGTVYAVTEKVQAPKATSLCMGANIVHSIDGMVVREMGRRCNYSAETINAFQELYYTRTTGGQSTARVMDVQLLRLLHLADMTGFVSAVIFEYVDQANYGLVSPDMREKLIQLIDTMPNTSFPLICIHDCFKFHPTYGNDVRRQYKQILSEIAASDILPSIASEITGRTITVNKASAQLPAKILASDYAIC